MLLVTAKKQYMFDAVDDVARQEWISQLQEQFMRDMELHISAEKTRMLLEGG